MSDLFLKILNMSISASWLVLAVVVLRLVLKKAPKWVSVLLWGIVAVRLVCPFSIESVLSLIPSAQTVSPEIMMDPTPQISTGIDTLNDVVNPIISQSFAPEPSASANPLQILIPVSAVVWLAGVAAMLLYTAVSFWLLQRKVRTAVLLRDNLYQSEAVSSPFVLGIIRPRIYLPFGLDGQSLAHVVAHECSHIRRKDHWWKPLGFLLLSIHWFNPLMWLAYILLCRDIELACDERVIGTLDSESKADYTQALVACSVNRRSIAACPLAFGEVGVKNRVKSVLNYKKPAFWIVSLSIAVCVAVAVCFLTDPPQSTVQDIYAQKGYTILEQEQVTLTLQIPTGGMSNAIYTYGGEEFEPGQLAVWQEEGTSIYLSHARSSEHMPDHVFFTFGYDYYFENYGNLLTDVHVILPPGQEYTHSTVFITPTNTLWDSAGQVFPDTLRTFGVNDAGEFTICVSKEACAAGKGILFMDIQLNRISYAKNGYKEEAVAFFEDQANSPVDLTPGSMSSDEFNFVAEILEIHEDFFLVKPESGWVINMPKLMEVPRQNIRASLEPQVGDHLLVTCDDTVWNTDPPRIANVLHTLLVPQSTQADQDVSNKQYLQSKFLGSHSPEHLLISSGGQIYEPYISGSSGDSAIIKPEEVKLADLLPSIPYCSDFQTVFPKGGWIDIVILYDENYQRISTEWTLDFLSSLESGTYYLDISILENRFGGGRNRYSAIFELVIPSISTGLPRMIMVNGELYSDTGVEGVMLNHAGIMLGLIDSSVSSEQIPAANNQSNFEATDTCVYHAGPMEGTLEVNIDGTWWIFATEEVWSDVQKAGGKLPEREPVLSLPDGTVALTPEERNTVSAWFAWDMDMTQYPMSNSFLTCYYSSLDELSVFEVFGPGCGDNQNGQISDAEREALIKRNEHFAAGYEVNRIDRDSMDKILRQNTGSGLDDRQWKDLEAFTYLEEYDAYYVSYGGTNWWYYRVVEGYRCPDRTLVLVCEKPGLSSESSYSVLTLRPVENGEGFHGYWFVSNLRYNG